MQTVAVIAVNLIKTLRMVATLFEATLEETDKRNAPTMEYTGRKRLKLASVIAFARVYLLVSLGMF